VNSLSTSLSMVWLAVGSLFISFIVLSGCKFNALDKFVQSGI
jgi:hypothetical protein